MLAAVLYGQEDLRLEQQAPPVPGPGEVLLRVTAATTCGTDLKVWRRGGHAKMLKPPTRFGHEGAGHIAALGDGVTGWQVGDRVVANNSAPCMDCFFCQRQEYSLCTQLVFNNGTFAEFLTIPAPIVQHNLLPIPEGMSDAIAAMTEPLACVLHGLSRSNIQSGDRVVILGDGAIGLMFVAALSLGYGVGGRGGEAERTKNEERKTEPLRSSFFPLPSRQHANAPCDIFLFGGSPTRLRVGEAFGASQGFNHRQVADVPGLVKSLTEGWGADVVIEATGVPSVWEQAIACVRPGGTVNLFGGCPRDTTITVSTEPLHYSELTLKGVFHSTPRHVRDALAMLAAGDRPFEKLISDERPLKDLQQTFYDMRDRTVIKVAMRP
ncbi:alcohol dehydrogenase catalytic domain-containing protein [Thermoleptolyngbya oregonensis NK1-22]|uniref:Alcohol dehydrogenase catalytic domain-containing protein n=1 Tax=Thermoleptolyngbya oregonensis NK1-22 TaxID=2547457 RepID=A0AA96Y618_9CYAN|nr:alcohol dehydrogenase catalytic domain-containing protein [Thermoleptolyngbya oregonensis NK1-22]